uniref:Putative serine/threonine-protein kinase tsua n=1 Tax=Panstrongylus lignarius TaxID=156445 RepID=A0A224XPB4_9HEMI
MKTACEEMNSRLNILFFLIVITWEEVFLWNIKQEEEVSGMKQRLQNFLFPPQNLQSSQISQEETQQNENKPDVKKEPSDAQPYEVDTSRATRRLKRSTNDQIYVLMPVDKNTRKIRSNLRQQHMVKLDLARTDIPWDVPNSVVLDDGIRKICLDMVTSSPKKRKKSDNFQYSEEDFNTNKLGKDQAKLLLYPNQVISEPMQGGCCPSPTPACTTPKPPICLNLQITNLITPDMVCKTKIYNTSYIDPNGNVRLSVIFFSDNPSNQPGQSIRKTMLGSSELTSKELTQMLQSARFDSLNKMNKWMNGSNLASDKIDKNTDQNDSIKSLFQMTENNEKNSSNTYINNDQLSQSQIIQNSFKSANSPSANLKGQTQLLSNTVEATNKPYFDRNEVNTTLALRTLLGLIQLMQAGNNNHEIQHTPQDTVNGLY